MRLVYVITWGQVLLRINCRRVFNLLWKSFVLRSPNLRAVSECSPINLFEFFPARTVICEARHMFWRQETCFHTRERRGEREGEYERKTSNLSEINAHICSLSLSCICSMHTFVSFSALFCPVTQRSLSPVGERPRCVTVPKHGHACWMMFSICKEQEHNFQKQQNIALLYLNLRKKITQKCSIF